MSQSYKLTEVINELNEKISMEPENANLYIRRGLYYVIIENNKKALNDYKQAIQLDPQNLKGYLHRGVCYLNAHKYQNALKDFSKAIQLNPKSWEGYLHKGRCYFEMEKYSEALNDFNAAAELNRQIAIPFYWIGQCHEEQSNYEEAIQNYSKVIKIYPLDSSTELKEFEQPFELFPQIAGIYLRLGIAYFKQNNYSKALDNFVKSIEADNQAIMYFLDVFLKEIAIQLIPAIKFYDTTMVEQDEEKEKMQFLDNSYNTLIDKFPNLPDCYLHRGIYSMAVGSMAVGCYNDAVKDFTRYIKLNPDNKFVYFLRGICYCEIKENDKAIKDDFYQSSEDLLFVKQQMEKYPLIQHTLDYSQFLGFVGQNSSIETMLKLLEIFLEIPVKEEMIGLAKKLDQLTLKDSNITDNLKTIISDIFYYYPGFTDSLNDVFERDGEDIFLINAKLSFLKHFAKRYLSKDIWWHIDLEYDENKGLHGIFSQEEINKQYNLTHTYIYLSEALQKKLEEEKNKATIEERNRIIRNQAHNIKNILHSVINPLQYLKRTIQKPQIDEALKHVDIIREMVNATSLSYSGSPDDFFYDAKNSDKGISLKEMIITSIEASIGNMVEDIGYYSNFWEQYFPDDKVYQQALAEYRSLQEISPDERFAHLKKFIKTYMFKLEIDFGKSEKFIMGNRKSSAVKMLALFNDLISNAIKYAAFVDKGVRLVTIQFAGEKGNIRFRVTNSFKKNIGAKTTGTGNLIVDNMIKIMDGKISRTEMSNPDCHITEIQFPNFWKGSNLE